MQYIWLFIISIIFPHLGFAGKDKQAENKQYQENITRMYKLLSPKFKHYSPAKVPLFTGDSERRAKNIIKQSNITKFLRPKYVEEGAEERFLKYYRPANGGTLLIDVINKEGQSEDIQAALALGAQVNAVDRNGNAALHHIIASKRKKEKKRASLTFVSQLLEAGADIHIPNNNQETPLSMAENKRLKSIVEKMKAYDQREKKEVITEKIS